MILAGCGPSMSGLVQGRIDNAFVKNLERFSPGATVEVNSPGGEEMAGLEAARVLRQRGYSVVVRARCISACADLLLAGATSIVLDHAVIGFHGNPEMFEAFRQTKPETGPDTCKLPSVSLMRQLYAESGLNIDFWREMWIRMPKNTLAIIPGQFNSPGCATVGQYGPTEMWLPTSIQLRDLMGLRFEGDVCADDPECVAYRLPQLIGRGRMVIVGDRMVRT
jgi:hypothetical protein